LIKYDKENLYKQRENIVKMLEIEDLHLTKNKNKFTNIQTTTNFQTNYNFPNNTANSENVIKIQTTSNDNVINKEEIDINFDFL
jgi:hypothetical protein